MSRHFRNPKPRKFTSVSPKNSKPRLWLHYAIVKCHPFEENEILTDLHDQDVVIVSDDPVEPQRLQCLLRKNGLILEPVRDATTKANGEVLRCQVHLHVVTSHATEWTSNQYVAAHRGHITCASNLRSLRAQMIHEIENAPDSCETCLTQRFHSIRYIKLHTCFRGTAMMQPAGGVGLARQSSIVRGSITLPGEGPDWDLAGLERWNPWANLHWAITDEADNAEWVFPAGSIDESWRDRSSRRLERVAYRVPTQIFLPAIDDDMEDRATRTVQGTVRDILTDISRYYRQYVEHCDTLLSDIDRKGLVHLHEDLANTLYDRSLPPEPHER